MENLATNGTKNFRADRRPPWRIVQFNSVMLAVLIFALIAGQGENDLIGWLCVPAFLLLIGFFARIALKQPTQLKVGPEGLFLPQIHRAPIPWQDIVSVYREPTHRSLVGRLNWLNVRLRDGAVPEFRLPTPKRLAGWYLGKIGVRIPLHGLEEPNEVIIEAIEEHVPVRAWSDCP